MPRPAFQTRTAFLGLMFCLLILGLTSCLGWFPGIEDSEDAQVVASNVPRDTHPQVSNQEVASLVEGNSQFAFDLLAQLSSDTQNVFFSPYSISSALAMTYAGARGNTQAQMGDVLHFNPTDQGIHPILNWLDLELAKRDQISPPFEGEGFELSIANAVWGQNGYEFLQDYLDTLAVNYGAGLRVVDFASNPTVARITINDWVEDETNGRIEELLPASAIDADTRLVLTNAISFVASWLSPFDEGQTHDEPFTPLAGPSVSVPMMRQVETWRYTRFEAGQAIELPYNGEQIAMLLLIPDAGQFEAFAAGLDADRYENIVEALQERSVDLGLPKFNFSYDVALSTHLKALGMIDAFLPGAADFSGMDGNFTLFISSIQHKAFVSVNEAGTQATAATAVVVAPTMTPNPPVSLTINRPFILIIRDIPTGTLLFVGSIVSP